MEINSRGIGGAAAGSGGNTFCPDAWRNRSKNMRCRTCMHYVRKGNGLLGRCRRHAPTLGGWPAVFESDWCGDHKLDEEKAI